MPIAVALALSYPLLVDFLRVSGKTDAQLMASFSGQAPEDVFGFGFWVTWVPLAILEVFFLVVASVLATVRWRRYVLAVAVLCFFAMSVLDYLAFAREWALFFGQ